MKVMNLKLIIIFILLAFFSFLSNPFGVDWPAYTTTNVDFSKFYYFKEPIGWSYALFIRYLPYSNYLSFALLIYLLFHSSYSLLNILCKDNPSKIIICLVLVFSNFYLLLSVNGLRQALALIFLLYSIASTYEDGFFKKYFLFVIGVLCHNSLILFLPLIVLSKLPLLSNHILVLPLLFLGDVINSISGKSYNLSVNDNSSAFLIVSLFLFSVQIFLSIYKRDCDKKIIFFNFYLLILTLSFFKINSAYERIVYYIIPIQIIIFSSSLDIIKPASIVRLILFAVFILSSIYSLTHPSVTNNFLNL